MFHQGRQGPTVVKSLEQAFHSPETRIVYNAETGIRPITESSTTQANRWH